MASLPADGRAQRGRRAAALGLAVAALCSTAAGCSGAGSGAGAKPVAATPTGGAGPAGAAGTTGGAGPQRPACGLVSPAEIEASLGGAKVAAGRESVDDARSVCFYPLATTADQGVIITSTTSPGAAAAFARVRDNLGPAAQPLDAGDRAFVAGAQAAVLKGTTLVAVLVTAREAGAGAAAKVAQAAAARL